MKTCQDQVENILEQRLKPYAYRVVGTTVYITKGNVGYIKTLLKENGFDWFEVKLGGVGYVPFNLY